ncbi:MAG: ABC-type zinc uptake system zinc chaperone [Cognaticolwellia sp.]
MYIWATHRRLIAIWLSAILLVLSVAASAHSIEHIDEGAKTHCTLCFHQHQFNNVLPQQDANLDIISQQVEATQVVQPQVIRTKRVTYLSRAPPLFL